jgi:predicted metalloendopeptidase
VKLLLTRTVLAAAILTQITAPVRADVAPTSLAGPNTGIDTQNIDTSVRAQDDFYSYVNGKWLKSTEIPADKSRWGAFNELDENSTNQLHSIIEQLSKNSANPQGPNAQKIADLYASFMDEAQLEKLGTTPLNSEFARINALTDKKQIPALMAHYAQIGVTAPFSMGIGQDSKDSTKMAAGFDQSGLGLPDRDYYIKDDAKLVDARNKYQAYLEKLLTLSGTDAATAKTNAAQIVALETELAKIQWTNVQNRDPIKTYNKTALKKLALLVPHFDWNSYLTDSGLATKVNSVIIGQPSYFKGLDSVLVKTPLDQWKAYFKARVISHFASSLSKAYVDESFAFYGTTLRGVPQNEPRWKRGVRNVDDAIGEGLGQIYVEQYFPPENKAKMEKLVSNLITAYHHSIDTLDWMSPATKLEAQKKLDKLSIKIGYPKKWRDYSPLEIKKDDLVGNKIRSSIYEYNYELNKLGKPVDRDEWGMTPQTVNAYYNPSMNEIVFPAAILQPPFFNASADDAVNYGGIGAVIGHEISHGFDDQGSQFDEVGNLRVWWSKQDHANFAKKTKALVTQYNAYSPLPGYTVNGELTLGENIADNSGLAIAYKAYHLSLGGKPAPVIDGMTGDQRFYLGWGQVWRGKVRDAQAIVYIKTDPHSPSQFRGNGALANQPGYYDAFGVKEGDKMYIAPGQRVIMW